MSIIEIEWDDGSIEHIAHHNIVPDEVESIFSGKYLFERGRQGRYCALGQSESGRYLFIVLAPRGSNIYGVVTARDMKPAERRRFRRRVRQS